MFSFNNQHSVSYSREGSAVPWCTHEQVHVHTPEHMHASTHIYTYWHTVKPLQSSKRWRLLTSTGSVDLILFSSSTNDFDANGATPNMVSADKKLIEGISGQVTSWCEWTTVPLFNVPRKYWTSLANSPPLPSPPLLSLPPPLSLSLPPSLYPSLPPSLPPSLAPSLYPSLPPSLPLSPLPLSLPLSFLPSLPSSLPPPSLPPSLPPSILPYLPPFLSPPSLPPSLAPSILPSLTPSLPPLSLRLTGLHTKTITGMTRKCPAYHARLCQQTKGPPMHHTWRYRSFQGPGKG